MKWAESINIFGQKICGILQKKFCNILTVLLCRTMQRSISMFVLLFNVCWKFKSSISLTFWAILLIVSLFDIKSSRYIKDTHWRTKCYNIEVLCWSTDQQCIPKSGNFALNLPTLLKSSSAKTFSKYVWKITIDMHADYINL